MNDPEKVRALLEPFGYRPWQTHGTSSGPASTDLPQWDEKLTRFLDDKAQTGARIKDLGWQEFDYIGLRLCLKDRSDPDEFVVRNWLLVHDLEDPRKVTT